MAACRSGRGGDHSTFNSCASLLADDAFGFVPPNCSSLFDIFAVHPCCFVFPSAPKGSDVSLIGRYIKNKTIAGIVESVLRHLFNVSLSKTHKGEFVSPMSIVPICSWEQAEMAAGLANSATQHIFLGFVVSGECFV